MVQKHGLALYILHLLGFYSEYWKLTCGIDNDNLAPASPSRQRLKTEQIIEESKKKKEVNILQFYYILPLLAALFYVHNANYGVQVYTILEDDDEFEEFEDYDNLNSADADMNDQADDDKLW